MEVYSPTTSAARESALSTAGRRYRSFLLLIGFCLWGLSGARLSAQGASQEPPPAQYIFVIDDSGSMSDERYGRNDPDRLAIFAVRALLGVLDDRDWASVVRLNGAIEGERPQPLARLSTAHRQRLQEVLSLSGELAAYDGQRTPCRSALEAARELLNAADRAGSQQVLIFLSDGNCDSGHESRLGDFLAGLHAFGGEVEDRQGRNRFRFYLLQMEGTTPADGLRRLAEQTGGAAISVRGADPTRILHAFAQALSHSQGYESRILTAGNSILPAHRGAERVRLLAVSPGGGSPLELGLADLQGNTVPVTAIDQAEHHYEPDGRQYRFVSAQYQPRGTELSVEVLGAGSDWDLVALPQYFLNVEMALQQGSCERDGAEVWSNRVATGSEFCGLIRLTNDRQQVVGRDITSGELRGALRISFNGAEPVEVPATPLSEDEAIFALDLEPFEEGHSSLQGAVYVPLLGGESSPPLLAPLRTMTAYDRAIEAAPGQLDFGDIFPGFTGTLKLAIHGRFDETEARFRLENPAAVPPCIELQLAGQPLGQPVRVLAQQEYALTVEVAKQCAEEAVAPLRTNLLVELPELAVGGAVAVPISWQLDSTVRDSDLLRLELAANTSVIGLVEAPPDLPSGSYRASLEALVAPAGAEEKDLRLGYFVEHSAVDLLVDAQGEVLRETTIEFGPDSALRLLADAEPCCGGGLFRGRLWLSPVGGGQAIKVPIEIQVRSDWWTCYRSWVYAASLGLLCALLVFYVLSMFAHSKFLNRNQLATSLVPLHWQTHGGAPQPAKNRGGDREVVEDMIHLNFSGFQRALNWLLANPLMFGLPNGRYRETLELTLASNLDGSSVMLISERDLIGRWQKASQIEADDEGRLFASAGSGLTFYAVRGRRGVVGELKPEGWYGVKEDLVIEQMRQGQRLIRKRADRERGQGGLAGWVLG